MKKTECPICGKPADHLDGNEYVCEYCSEKFTDDFYCPVCGSENIRQTGCKVKCLNCNAVWSL